MSPAAADTLRDEQVEVGVEVGVEVEEEEAPKPKKKGGGRRRQPDPPPLTGEAAMCGLDFYTITVCMPGSGAPACPACGSNHAVSIA
jgi:hypothetical protein